MTLYMSSNKVREGQFALYLAALSAKPGEGINFRADLHNLVNRFRALIHTSPPPRRTSMPDPRQPEWDACANAPHYKIPFRYCPACSWRQCGSDYHTDTGRTRSGEDRLILCTLDPGHDGDHAEQDTDGLTSVEWPQRKPEPRTWSLPPEPGPEVKAVRDRFGEVWRRDEDQRIAGWRKPANISGIEEMSWLALYCEYSPLTDATGEVC